MDKRPIGVFDSGVGGLSILIELKKLLPNENFVFLADQKYVPYGEKSKPELVNLCSNITDFLIKKYKIKMLVIACNTATCYSIQEIRDTYSIPVVGTEPAIKPASETSKTKIIAVISTPATSKSKTIKRLIREFAKNVEVLNIGCRNLENMVEKGNINSGDVKNLLGKYLDPVLRSKADRLVLGCTHYPFLRKSIGNILGKKVKLIDSGKAIAKRTKFLLKKNKILGSGPGKTTYLTTGDNARFQIVATKLLGRKIVAKKAIL